jgi:hypothetical protein
MAERRYIEAMVERKEQEIQDLESRIKEANVYLQALRDVLKRFPRDAEGEETAAKTLRPGSMVAKARELILQAKKPLHVDAMLEMQGKELTRDNRTALGGSLSAYVRKGVIFTRDAPNTFGLIELEGKEAPTAGPPPGFGTDDPPHDDIPFDDIPFEKK